MELVLVFHLMVAMGMVSKLKLVSERVRLFFTVKDFYVLLVPLVRFFYKSKTDPIYCDDNIAFPVIRHINSKFKVRFSGNTRFIAVKEQFIDRVYTKYPDFLPRFGGTIIDIGSETGDYALLCAIHYSSKAVHSFEPDPTNYSTLLENIKLNSLNKVIIPYNKALSSTNSNQSAFYNGDTISWTNKETNLSLEVITLDSLNMTEIDILKIDAEGNELEVLKGSIGTIESTRPRIIIETHSRELREQVTEFLELLNFQVAHIGNCSCNRDGSEICNLFFKLNSH